MFSERKKHIIVKSIYFKSKKKIIYTKMYKSNKITIVFHNNCNNAIRDFVPVKYF